MLTSSSAGGVMTVRTVRNLAHCAVALVVGFLCSCGPPRPLMEHSLDTPPVLLVPAEAAAVKRVIASYNTIAEETHHDDSASQ